VYFKRFDIPFMHYIPQLYQSVEDILVALVE